MIFRHHIKKREDGQAMVEFAMVAPILLMLVLGIIQFGIVFNHYMTLTDAVRAGARQAAVSRTLPEPGGDGGSTCALGSFRHAERRRQSRATGRHGDVHIRAG